MRFANIDGHRHEAEPGLSGECPVCGAITIAKCGEKKIWHWAHKSKRKCDQWWENETEWHRFWKNQFPIQWQERVQIADDGEKHIADVKTDQGWVLEIQHSYIKPEERRSREAFYGKMVWLVDALRRKNDLKQFLEAVQSGIQVSQKPLIVKVHPLDSRLVEDWATSPVPVLFDFGDSIQPQGLWLLFPLGLDYTAYFTLVGKEDFVGWHQEGVFKPEPFIEELKKYEQQRKRAMEARSASQLVPRWIPSRPRRRF